MAHHSWPPTLGHPPLAPHYWLPTLGPPLLAHPLLAPHSWPPTLGSPLLAPHYWLTTLVSPLLAHDAWHALVAKDVVTLGWHLRTTFPTAGQKARAAAECLVGAVELRHCAATTLYNAGFASPTKRKNLLPRGARLTTEEVAASLPTRSDRPAPTIRRLARGERPRPGANVLYRRDRLDAVFGLRGMFSWRN